MFFSKIDVVFPKSKFFLQNHVFLFTIEVFFQNHVFLSNIDVFFRKNTKYLLVLGIDDIMYWNVEREFTWSVRGGSLLDQVSGGKFTWSRSGGSLLDQWAGPWAPSLGPLAGCRCRAADCHINSPCSHWALGTVAHGDSKPGAHRAEEVLGDQALLCWLWSA